MSDAPQSATPGTLSPRNIDTMLYRVVRELPVPALAVGTTFTSWPQGETFACVSGVGLGPVKNSDIASWLEQGMIVRETPLTPAQERAVFASLRSGGTEVAETASTHSSATRNEISHPWTLSGAEGGKR